MTFQDLREAVNQLILDVNRIKSIIDEISPPTEKTLADYIVDYYEYKCDRETGLEYERPHRYLLQKIDYIPFLFYVDRIPGLEKQEPIATLIRDGRMDILDELKTLAAPLEYDATAFKEKLAPVHQQAQRIWEGKYPERLRMRLNDEYTLGQLVFKLLDRGRPTSTREVADILGVTYDHVYHSDIRSLLAREGVKFVRRVK